MYVRRTGLIMGLALLTSGYAIAGQNSFDYLSGYKHGQYSASDGIKAKFKQDPLTYEADIRAKLNDIASAIDSRTPTNIRNRQNKFVKDERAWVDSVMASFIPAIPVGAPPVLTLPPITPPPAVGTAAKAQQAKFQQLYDDFGKAFSSKDIKGMQAIYANMQAILPTLTLIKQTHRDQLQQEAFKAIKTIEQEEIIEQLIADFNAAAAKGSPKQMWSINEQMKREIPKLTYLDPIRTARVLRETQAALDKINRRAQVQQANKLVADFDAAKAVRNLVDMQRIYDDMRRLFPTFNLMDESSKNESLADAQRAIEAERKAQAAPAVAPALSEEEQRQLLTSFDIRFDKAKRNNDQAGMLNIKRELELQLPRITILTDAEKQEYIKAYQALIDVQKGTSTPSAAEKRAARDAQARQLTNFIDNTLVPLVNTTPKTNAGLLRLQNAQKQFIDLLNDADLIDATLKSQFVKSVDGLVEAYKAKITNP